MQKSRNDFLNDLASKKIKYNLGPGVPPLDLYPNLNLEKYFTGFNIKSNHDIIGYHHTTGLIQTAASKFLKVNEGLTVDSDNIVISNGVQEAITLTISLFRNSTLACLDPSYPGFEDAAATFGCKVKKLKNANWIKQLEKLPEGSLFYLSSDFSNPEGYSISMEDRNKLVEIAKKNKFFIFDDATYRPFNLDVSFPSLLSLNSDSVIHAVSFSKILAPGLRTAFIYIPQSLKSGFVRSKSNISLNNSGITQFIIKRWLEENNYSLKKQLNAIKQRLIANREITRKFNISYNGGFFCTIALDKVADYTFCEKLLENEKIAVIPMELFTQETRYKNQLRLCIANIDAKELDLVLNKIIKYIA